MLNFFDIETETCFLLSIQGSSSQQRDSLPSSPRETTAFESDSSSGGSSPYEDFNEGSIMATKEIP